MSSETTNNQFKTIETVDLIRYYFSKKWIIIGLTALAAAISVGVSLNMPNEYKSTANLLPNKGSSGSLLSMLAGGSSGLGGAASALLGGTDEKTEKILVILDSYSLKKQIIDKYDLKNHYDPENKFKYPIEETLEELNDHTEIVANEDGNILISFWDVDKKLAQQVTQTYVDILNEMNTTIEIQEAKQMREFIERKYLSSQKDIDSLQLAFKRFQTQTGIYDLKEQMKAHFTVLGEIESGIIELEMKAAALSTTQASNSASIRTIEKQINALKMKKEDVIKSASESKEGLLFDPSALPEYGVQYFDLISELEKQVKIQEFIVPAYEEALLNEAKAIPVVTVIDKPLPAEKKYLPRRAVIVLLSTISTFVLILMFLSTLCWYNLNKDQIINK